MDRFTISLCAALALLILAAMPASAKDDARLSAFIGDPALRQHIINTAAKSAVMLRNPCGGAQYRVANEPYVVKPLAFGGRGPSDGALKFPVQVDACGTTRLLNVLVSIEGEGQVVAMPLLPGTTHASLTLQKDAARYAWLSAQEKPAIAKGCHDGYIEDTKFVARDGAGPWAEVWTVVLCGTPVSVPLRFIPDANGTQIVAQASAG